MSRHTAHTMVSRGLEPYGTAGGCPFPEWSHALLALFPSLSLTRFMDLYMVAYVAKSCDGC